MDSLQNMGTLGLREIEAIIRRQELHDPGVLQLQVESQCHFTMHQAQGLWPMH